jgi:hypothetical protein
MTSKNDTPKKNDITGLAGLSGKSITGVAVFQQGSTTIIEINFVGGPYYVKVQGLQVERGGTTDWGSGTLVL